MRRAPGSVTPSRSRAIAAAARCEAPAAALRAAHGSAEGASWATAVLLPGGSACGSASARHFAKTAAALPLHETSSSFGSLMFGGYGITRTAMPAPRASP